MASTWEEASKCPRDGAFTGKVVNRKALRTGGQLVTLECPEDNCPYHGSGWIVQIRPDNTIPDVTPPEQRQKNFAPTPVSQQRKRAVLDALEAQTAQEQKPGAEVRGY